MKLLEIFEFINTYGLKTALFVLAVLGIIAMVIYLTKTWIEAYFQVKQYEQEQLINLKGERYEEILTEFDRILYEGQMSMEAGKTLTSEESTEAFIKLNQLASKMYISVPDNVVFLMKNMIDKGTISPNDRNELYYEIRKEFYPDTKVTPDDLMWLKPRQGNKTKIV